MNPASRASSVDSSTVAFTGVQGLDDVLGGGLAANRLYLIEGVPGSGKTTLALRFLLEGVRNGEPVLYVTLSETADELRAGAASHGWSLEGVDILEILPTESSLSPDSQYTMFHPSEVELSETTREILARMQAIKPARVVFDSLSEIRLLAGSALRYRRQILALKHHFTVQRATVLLLDDRPGLEHDLHVQSIAHGVIALDQLHPEYGTERRRLRVVKFRGRSFRGGFHDYAIRYGGLAVFPRLVAAEHRAEGVGERLPSGIGGLDSLLGGGIEHGTSTLLLGAAGTGKSSLAAKFVVAAADRDRPGAMFLFDERLSTLLSRTEGLGIDLRKHVDSGRVMARQIDPAELSPGELVQEIRFAVEDQGVRVLVIDSLNGYLNAMPDERFLTIQLHELLMYLGQRGVATLLIGAQHGLVGGQMTAPIDASYLADAVILLRYYEAHGAVHQAISVVKKRGSEHERTIREFELRRGGIWVGEPLREFRGVLTGVPVYEGSDALASDER